MILSDLTGRGDAPSGTNLNSRFGIAKADAGSFCFTWQTDTPGNVLDLISSGAIIRDRVRLSVQAQWNLRF